MAMGAADHDKDTENTGSSSPQTAEHTDALLWYRVEDENALTQSEVEEKQKFEQCKFSCFVS